MGKTKCALLDTDFISKLHITRKDDGNRFIDRVLELPGYQFVCHEQITIELARHNTSAKDWLKNHIDEGSIQRFTDKGLIENLRLFYGNNATLMYLHYLNHACNLFDSTFYDKFYGGMEQKLEVPDDEFAMKMVECDLAVGYDHNLGEIKTFLLQQVLQNCGDVQLYVFCSDDRKARSGLTYAGGVPSVSALASFYVVKERLGMDRIEAKLYFDSWMQFHRNSKQTSFKVYKATKEQQMVKMDGYEIFDRIYDGTIGMAIDGDLLLRNI